MTLGGSRWGLGLARLHPGWRSVSEVPGSREWVQPEDPQE